MNSSRLLKRLRIEDAVTVSMAIVLATYAGSQTVARSIRISGEDLWALSFILFPVSILLLLASIRYAFRPQESGFSSFLTESLTVVRDWMPFFLFLLFYSQFNSRVWLLLNPETYDAQLLSIDRWLFGETPSVLMQRWASPALSNILGICYFLHVIFPPVIAALWYRRELRMFREFLLATLLSGFFGAIGYALVPAVGPQIAFPGLFTVNLNGEIQQALIGILDMAKAPRDVFPSLHVAVSAIALYYAFRHGRFAAALLAPMVLGNWISTMYLRAHYFIDVVAGWVVAIACVTIAHRLLIAESRWASRPAAEPAGTDAASS